MEKKYHKKMGNFQLFQDTARGRGPITVCVPEGLWGAATAPELGLGKDGDRDPWVPDQLERWTVQEGMGEG